MKGMYKFEKRTQVQTLRRYLTENGSALASLPDDDLERALKKAGKANEKLVAAGRNPLNLFLRCVQILEGKTR